MKLLFITQKLDRKDTVLGAYHRWIEEFSKRFESIIVICLYKGDYDLPANVKVFSLGKENGESKVKYMKNLYKYIWRERKNYDKVFVHMNQEYILLGGIFWKMWNKQIYMWRNHHSGSLLTHISAYFCVKVFCTSKFSFTAKYRKSVIMPVGVDLDNFKENSSIPRIPQSILFLARIAPVKRPDLYIDAVIDIRKRLSGVTAHIYGDAQSKDESYYKSLKNKAGENINFHAGVINKETVNIYSAHDIFVNLSSSGMYDKTILEAMACGCLVLASNDNLRGEINDDFIFRQGDLKELVEKLEKLLKYSDDERLNAVRELQVFAEKHSLKRLVDRLFNEIL